MQNLTALYGEGGASYLAKRLMSIAMGELMSAPADTQRKPNLLSANDRMLICYGDSIRDEPASPLSALQRFATTHLAKAYRRSMSCRSSPLLRMTALRLLTIKRSDRISGDWSDINALSEHFDLMFDLVINHCSRENLWFADFIGGRAPGCDYFHEMSSMIGLGKSSETQKFAPAYRCAYLSRREKSMDHF